VSRLLLAVGLLALAAADPVVIEDWRSFAVGSTGTPKGWRTYGRGGDWKYPPTILQQDGRRALRLQTAHYSIRLGKGVDVDLTKTPVIEWEWNVKTLPRQGDVRTKINDQGARVMGVFGPRLKPTILGYVWDTKAPVKTEVRTESPERWLIVVRSGSDGLGQWHGESRNIAQDYARLFGRKTPDLLAVGVESHSEDANHESEAMFGRLRFKP
jgi:hypothetical protein